MAKEVRDIRSRERVRQRLLFMVKPYVAEAAQFCKAVLVAESRPWADLRVVLIGQTLLEKMGLQVDCTDPAHPDVAVNKLK